ncbi:DUF2147 domain-containing protein [Fluviicola sp.]|jgi:uncharacterized protein (DUF2147 family)|uniref:DUF2147 domain-containing protein n=1 Tax=Fluviicola sp. TaxID=1917219 RepID=UPI00283968DB|nr:DUF2147 domain-containing protein [Fluviicola sp.]MDR0801188.1 DUF2147 domain-containing protein [Fluviicola sp.]
MKWVTTSLFILFFIVVKAQTCIGTWVTIDDKTGKKKSKVELYKKDDKLYGKIIYLYPREGREDNPKCEKCTDDRKNQPLVGLQIVRGLKWDGSEWKDGTIVDPENGKVYTCSIWIDRDDYSKLHVRGYVGPFFRTQTWHKSTD